MVSYLIDEGISLASTRTCFLSLPGLVRPIFLKWKNKWVNLTHGVNKTQEKKVKYIVILTWIKADGGGTLRYCTNDVVGLQASVTSLGSLAPIAEVFWKADSGVVSRIRSLSTENADKSWKKQKKVRMNAGVKVKSLSSNKISICYWFFCMALNQINSLFALFFADHSK